MAAGAEEIVDSTRRIPYKAVSLGGLPSSRKVVMPSANGLLIDTTKPLHSDPTTDYWVRFAIDWVVMVAETPPHDGHFNLGLSVRNRQIAQGDTTKKKTHKTPPTLIR